MRYGVKTPLLNKDTNKQTNKTSDLFPLHLYPILLRLTPKHFTLRERFILTNRDNSNNGYGQQGQATTE